MCWSVRIQTRSRLEKFTIIIQLSDTDKPNHNKRSSDFVSSLSRLQSLWTRRRCAVLRSVDWTCRSRYSHRRSARPITAIPPPPELRTNRLFPPVRPTTKQCLFSTGPFDYDSDNNNITAFTLWTNLRTMLSAIWRWVHDNAWHSVHTICIIRIDFVIAIIIILTNVRSISNSMIAISRPKSGCRYTYASSGVPADDGGEGVSASHNNI